ncbi:hypothetical protein SAMN05421866_3856 [Chryseobacterium oranimense]|uniref:Uncharacterized protein n=1 Tax=Chryseobacterium oranimense TaxID=421058 RepID=A0A1M5W331_9FLAO|nr:hypothetical protein [Chryseobacterium oranimense]CEJ71808.1 hypothetical protein BN1195_04159 [Chryseobacterium oranimense G311]SHH81614.1 hypothetical protein SAMN05421866_3856 [Chryseobacterium oranimense]
MQNQQTIQGILSIAALVCLAAGWFNLFSPEINHILSGKIFYYLIGASFFFQAPLLSNKNFTYAMYAAALICVVGATLPEGSKFSVLKTIGLLGGILLSFTGKPKRS